MTQSNLERAIRSVAEAPRAAAWTDEIDDKVARELREASELCLVLARLLAGKTVHEAFGAPGDWGYGTPLGDAILEVYRANGGSAKLVK